jgi:hypothetical protein
MRHDSTDYWRPFSVGAPAAEAAGLVNRSSRRSHGGSGPWATTKWRGRLYDRRSIRVREDSDQLHPSFVPVLTLRIPAPMSSSQLRLSGSFCVLIRDAMV